MNSFYTRTALFKTRPVNEWDWEQICGFYNYCRETLTDTGFNFDFGYVNNPSGGFHGMWIWKPVFVNANGLKCEVYLQCEYIDSELRICYRASNDNEKIMGATRDLMIWKEERGKRVKITEKYNFKEPQRYGAGKSVALGVYKAKIKTFEDAVAAIRSAIADFKNLVTELPQI